MFQEYVMVIPIDFLWSQLHRGRGGGYCMAQMYFVRDSHCKDTVPRIGNKYSQKRNCGASFSIPKFMYL